MVRLTASRALLAIIVITVAVSLLVTNYIWLDLGSVRLSSSPITRSSNHPNNRDHQLSAATTTTTNAMNADIGDHSHSYHVNLFNEKPWFMSNGTRRPTKRISGSLAIWPEELPTDDRIVNQLMYVPDSYDRQTSPLKTIVLYMGRNGWHDLPMGRNKFIADKCPVDRCVLSSNGAQAGQADAILFKERFQWPKHRRPVNQIWILFLLECPSHTQLFNSLGADVFNWTATYRHDSDIVAPYEKFVPYKPLNLNVGLNQQQQQQQQNNMQLSAAKRNWAHGKTKYVAWFVSNCGARNKRLEYARQLSRYIEVDIYGSCGNKKCPRNRAQQCFDMLNRDYRFYLAFENSNCRDYITEKFYINGLGLNSLDYNLIPIVMGAHRDDYTRLAPKHSYIHVDDFESPESLARYLHILATNDDLYNEYFEWKSGGGEFINTYFWCRVCALLHSRHPKPSRSYTNIANWWSPTGICNNSPYRRWT